MQRATAPRCNRQQGWRSKPGAGDAEQHQQLVGISFLCMYAKPLSAAYLLALHPAVRHTPAASAQLEADLPLLTLTAQVFAVPLAARLTARGALSSRHLLGREGPELLPAGRHATFPAQTPATH